MADNARSFPAYPYAGQTQQAINPALLAFQRNAGPNNMMNNTNNPGVNPAQLLSGINPQALMGANGIGGGVSPAMMGSINPAALSVGGSQLNMGMNMNGASGQQLPFQQPGGMSPQDLQMMKAMAQRQSQHSGQHHMNQQSMQYSNPQQQQAYYASNSMPPPQQIAPRPQAAMAIPQPQVQSMAPPPRPPTATSSSRPGTATGHHSLNHNMGQNMGHPQGQAMAGPSNGYPQQQHMSRPPSRPQTAGSNHSGGASFVPHHTSHSPQPQPQANGSFGAGGGQNGYPGQVQQPGLQNNQFAGHMGRTPTPAGGQHVQGLPHAGGPKEGGSPYQGMKRKLMEGSPQPGGGQMNTQNNGMGTPRIMTAGLPGGMAGMGGMKNQMAGMGMAGMNPMSGMGGMGAGMMPPPSLPRQHSGDQSQDPMRQLMNQPVPPNLGMMNPGRQVSLEPQAGNPMTMSASMNMMNGMSGVAGMTGMPGMTGMAGMVGMDAGMAALSGSLPPGTMNSMTMGTMSGQSQQPMRAQTPLSAGPGNIPIPNAMGMGVNMLTGFNNPTGLPGPPAGPHPGSLSANALNPNVNGAGNSLPNSSMAMGGMSNISAMNIGVLNAMNSTNAGAVNPALTQAQQDRKAMTAMAAMVQSPVKTIPVPAGGGIGGTAIPFQPAARPVTGGLSSAVAAAAQVQTQPPSASAASTSTILPATAATASGVNPTLSSLPGNLNAAVTRLTVVPLAQSAALIPPLSTDEVTNVKGWMARDSAYEGVYRIMRDRMRGELAEAAGRPRWWERDPERDALIAAVERERDKRRGVSTGPPQFHLVYPRSAQHRERERRGGKTPRREGLRLPRKLKPGEAERPEQLVPIRLEFDVEHQRYRDTFVWNVNDPIVTPEAFAQSVIEDYGLSSSYLSVITKSIQEQLSDYKTHTAALMDGEETSHIIVETQAAPPEKGSLDGEDLQWWESWRKRLRTKNGYVKAKASIPTVRLKKKRKGGVPDSTARGKDDAFASMEVNDFKLDEEKMHEEMRILIKLDITVGSMKLDDQFEWDIENLESTPEQFADVYGNDLGLAGEFKTAVAHAIREQVQAYQKSLFLVGHPLDGSAIQDDDLRLSFLPTLSSGPRSVDQTQAFTPLLNYLSDGELERIDREREKELNKRRKRNTRGRRGIALPDREPLKTHRTPAIGFPEVDPTTLALAAAAAPPTARRAAAAAASLTIANMVASENGTTILPQTVPIAPQAPIIPVSKVPKAKGSFKTPAFPSTILKPRSKVAAPTTSTAADASAFGPTLEGDTPLPPSSSTIVVPPDSRSNKVVSARRQRELEKEAKEKEFADGQHANIINGVWHCSNCGCPDSVAIGRRKGPLGDKSQCGACGKFWHRHRRPRPVEYHTDAEYHLNIRQDSERTRAPVKRRGAAALRAQNAQQEQTPPPAVAEQDAAVVPNHDMWIEIKSPRKGRGHQSSDATDVLDRPLSPASSVSSSASERPLAQTVLQVNGTGHSKPVSSNASKTANENGTQADSVVDQSAGQNSSNVGSEPPSATQGPDSTSTNTPPATARPQWLEDAMNDMLARYPDDRFDIIQRRGNGAAANEWQWRVKCLDCPGKLYTPGPGESLNNYEVHLKNRQHRAKVANRLNGAGTS